MRSSWASWDSCSAASTTPRTLADFGGYLASLILDPLKPERVDHIAIAVGCLVVTFAAIIYTVISALPYLR